MNMSRYFCNVSFQRRSLCATIECRAERKRMKSIAMDSDCALFFIFFFVAIDSRSSVSNHSEIDWPALNISCALCSTFTKNWLDDRLHRPNRCDRLSCAQARLLRCCFLSFLFFFLRFLRQIAFTLVKYSIYVLPGSFFYSHSIERFVYATRIIYWLLMSNGYLFIVCLMNYSRCLL